MDSPRKSALFPALALSIVMFPFAGETIAAPKINQKAQALAKMLGPSALNAKSGSAGDIAAIRKRAIPILEAMEATYRTNGPTPESLIANAYDFRKGIGPYEEMVTSQALVAAWKEASAMGLFDENRKFRDRIGDGRFKGEAAVFEHIVPAEVYPAGSTHLSNFRIVAPDRKREPGREPTARERAFGQQLVKVVNEIERGKRLAAIEKKMPDKKPVVVNAVGQTAAEAKKRWQKEVELAGESFNQKPSINIEARVAATPSHMTRYRYRVMAEVQNRSRFPTQVEVEYWLLGITWKKRDHYVMTKGKKTLQLRKGEEVELEFFTGAEGGYKAKADKHDGLNKFEKQRSQVTMRGIIVRVTHATGVAEIFASDQHLKGYVDDRDKMNIGSLPVW